MLMPALLFKLLLLLLTCFAAAAVPVCRLDAAATLAAACAGYQRRMLALHQPVHE